MATSIRVQASHSRNSNDWKLRKDATGRLILDSNEKGVFLRIGLLASFLHEKPHSGVECMGDFLRSIHKSYRNSDVSQPLRQMLRHGIVKASGGGRYTTYSLTNNGMRIVKSAQAEWV